MKKTILTIFLALSAMFMVGCEDDNPEVLIIDEIPAAPQGVYSVTGDGAVYVYWNGPYEEDIDYFVVYRSLNATTGYTSIGVTNAGSNPNLDLITYEYTDNSAVNGVTYYYAVAAVDEAGQESELSAEDVFDTPRPEGIVTLSDYYFDSTTCALILDTTLWITAVNDPDADIYIDSDINAFYVNASNSGVDLQDMGYTDSFDEISYAPTDGWSNNGWTELILGHTYVIWDDDLFFAKLRVQSMTATSVTFQWGFQIDNNNPELVKPKFEAEKPVKVNYVAKRSAALNQ